MGTLAFLEAAFLAGLAAAAVPVVIHLMHRRRSRTVPFPTLRFLREVDVRTARRSRLRERLVLLVRVLALAALALAFARPVLRESGALGRGRGSRAIVLDNSMSMEARVAGATALERSRLAALELLAGLDPADRTAVVAVHEAEGAAPALTEDRRSIEEALRAVPSMPFSTPLAAAIERAWRIVEADSNPVREVLVFSDLQATAFAGALRPPPDRVRTVLLVPRPPDAPNLSIAAVAALPSGSRKVPLLVRVRNHGAAEAVASLTIRLDGKTVEERAVRAGPGAEVLVPAGPFEILPGLHDGLATLGEDPLLPDNVHAFAIDVPEAVRVLAARDPAPSAADDPAFYIVQALRPAAAAGTVRAKVIETAALEGEDLGAADVVVLAEPARLGAGAVAALARFLRGGGGILFAAGPGQSAEEFRDLSAGGGSRPETAILPARLLAIVTAREEPFRLREWDPDHPLWEPLLAASPPLRPGLPRFTSYWKVEPAPPAAVLARFDSGDPAIVEAAMGRGRTILFASTLRPRWNNLPLKFSFVPLVHSALRYLAGSAREGPRGPAGLPIPVPYPEGALPEEVVLRLGDGTSRPLSPRPDPGGGAIVEIPPLPPGLHRLEERRGTRTAVRAVAVNPVGAESALAPPPPERLAELIPGARVIEFGTPAEAARAAMEGSVGSELKTPLLFILLALILLEPMLANAVAFRRSREAEAARAAGSPRVFSMDRAEPAAQEVDS